MTTKDELKAKKRHRYMLQGPVGSGKSYTLVLLAKRYAEQGKHVFYIDFRDIGSADELMKLDENVLSHITYKTPQEYGDLLRLNIPTDVGLIVFDAMHHLRFRARKYIREQYIKQERYTSGGAVTKIEDTDTFDLGVLGYGAGYSAANIREGDIIDKILNASCDVAISVIPDPLKDTGVTFTEILAASFDNIITLSFRDTDVGIREWFYKLYRWRGIDTNDYSEQRNEGDTDPFALIEKTGGKSMKEYMVRFKLAGESKKEFITAIDAEEAEAELKAMYANAEEVEVIE
jgi:energy-coupling factor transporter ATP-binding protein EcfA2